MRVNNYLRFSRRVKLQTSVILILFSLGLYAIRRQTPLILGIVSIGLLYFIIRKKMFLALVLQALLFVYVYSGPHLGWLYGFDTHSPAAISEWLSRPGTHWPNVNILVSWGDISTPLLHIYTVMIHLITELSILPTTQSQVLVSALLPIAFTTLSLVFAGLTIRRRERVQRSNLVLSLVPLIFWIPLYWKKTAFRRQSLGILLFAFVVFCLFRMRSSRQFRSLAVVALFALTVTHHLTMAVVMIFSVVLTVVPMILSKGLQNVKSDVNNLVIGFPILAIVAFVSWNILYGQNASLFSGLLALLLSDGHSALAASGESARRWEFIQETVARWGYQTIVGVGIAAGAVEMILQRRSDNWLLGIFGFGVVCGTFAGLAYFSSLFSSYRIMTFFTIAGAGLLIPNIRRITYRLPKRISPDQTTVAVVLAIVFLSALMFPVGLISGQTGYSATGEYSERFDNQIYAVTDYLSGDNITVIGDKVVMEILIPMAQTPVETRMDIVRGERPIPDESVVVLGNRNRYTYIGLSGAGNSFQRLDMNQRYTDLIQTKNVVYDNGNYHVLSRSIT